MSDSTCAICLSSLQKAQVLPCQHAFCEGCINLSLQSMSNCPICRRVYCLMIGRNVKQFDSDKKHPIYKTKNILECEEIIEIPFLQTEATVVFGNDLLFKIESDEDIEAVNKALERDLLICVPRVENCDIWLITRIKSKNLNTNQPHYECMFRNVGRGVLMSQCDASTGLVRVKRLTDTVQDTEQEIKQNYSQISQILIGMKQKSSRDDQELIGSTFGTPLENAQIMQIEGASLRMLSYLRMNENSFRALYFGTDLLQRLQVIKKHLLILDEFM